MACVKHMAPLFTTFDPSTYQQLIVRHIGDVLSMPQPLLTRGDFVVSISGRLWHSVGIDEAYEMLINKSCKTSIVQQSADLAFRSIGSREFLLSAYSETLVYSPLPENIGFKHLLRDELISKTFHGSRGITGSSCQEENYIVQDYWKTYWHIYGSSIHSPSTFPLGMFFAASNWLQLWSAVTVAISSLLWCTKVSYNVLQHEKLGKVTIGKMATKWSCVDKWAFLQVCNTVTSVQEKIGCRIQVGLLSCSGFAKPWLHNISDLCLVDPCDHIVLMVVPTTAHLVQE